MGNTLDTTATLQCPHGGRVMINTSNTRVLANGIPVALQSDSFTIAGCPLNSPCVKVIWLVPDLVTRAIGTPTLSRSSIGICLGGDGFPRGLATVLNTQPRVSSR
jgi:hypothetical protein